MRLTSKTVRGVAVLAVMLLSSSIPVTAQVIDDVEELAWDRPEAWAMKFFNSVSVFTGLGAPRERDPWSGAQCGLAERASGMG